MPIVGVMGVNIIHFVSQVSPVGLEATLVESLKKTGASIFGGPEFIDLVKKKPSTLRDHNYIFIGTGGIENKVVEFVQAAKMEPPVLLLSHEGINSLPAAMEVRTGLQQQGFDARIIHAHFDNLMEELREWVFFASLEDRIREAQFGIIGEPSFWLVGSGIDAVAIKDTWGFEIQQFPLTDVIDRMGEEVSSEYKPVMKDLIDSADSVDRPQEEVERAAVFSQTLREYVTEKKLSTVTVECFKLFGERNVSGCHALSHLNDLEGITAGCEGDIPSTFTMMLAEIMTGRPAFMANVADVDPQDNSAIFAHCTTATSLIENYEVTTHYETGKSIAIRGRFKLQPVTVLKVSGSSLNEYWISRGDIIENTTRENACRTQIRVRLDEPVSYFLNSSLANHHVVVLGDYAEKFKRFLTFKLEA
ncbi:MAG: hypothetical protein ACXAEN_09380 [Candidatus Thorarchaeota archaeon]